MAWPALVVPYRVQRSGAASRRPFAGGLTGTLRGSTASVPGISRFARSTQTRPLRAVEIYPDGPNYLGTQHVLRMLQQADQAYRLSLQSIFKMNSGAPATTEYGIKCTGAAVEWQVL